MRGGRRHADGRDFAARPIDPDRRMNVIVPVQDQFHAVPFQQRDQIGRIGQSLDAGSRSQGMMDQQHAKCLLAGEPFRIGFQRVELARPSYPVAIKRRRRDRRGHADQRQRATPAQERKSDVAVGRVVAAEIILPGLGKAMLRGANIGVVIAGNDRDTIRRADAFQPVPRRREFASSARLTRSPVTAMWSGGCACISATSASSTSRRWYLWRLRVQFR